MANQEHLDILKEGIKAWNAWREQHPDIKPDLRWASLVHLNLRGAMLSDADFTGADLTGADLIGANLNHARLWFANLRDATVGGFALLFAAESRVEVTRAELRDTDFDRASFGNTILVDVDPSKTRNLATAEHRLPSTIGLDTIYTSEGKIPESFLRGAGVPDNFIEYMKSLTGAALEYYSCFISYSTKDQAFADRLYANLQARGVRCWFAPHDIQGGQKIHEQIDEAIRVYDKLLLVLSEASMSSSWVKTEVANARAREDQQKRQMLFPIAIVAFDRIKDWKLFDADRGTDSAREVREYFIPDFSNWKDHDSYQKAFDRLCSAT